MKGLLLGLALFSSTIHAATVCYKSDLFAISSVDFIIKNAEQLEVSWARFDNLMFTWEKCITIDESKYSVTVDVYHLTGLVWEPVANTCKYENIKKNMKVVAHGTTLNYHCTTEE